MKSPGYDDLKSRRRPDEWLAELLRPTLCSVFCWYAYPMNNFKSIVALTLLLSVAHPVWAKSDGGDGPRLVRDNEGWVYVDRDNRPVLRPYIFDNGPDYFEEGLARFVENGKMGFHDKALNIIIPAKYDFVYPFENGIASAGTRCRTQKHGEHSSVFCEKWENVHKPKESGRPG
ncbi:WG repeat-containing protein [Advenella mimigardefordensis]|nr:WG repeat-containing protein [Advenella mimigardefordensis]